MIDTNQDKKEISKKLKDRAIFEGFTIAGIASIPGSSRIKLRTNALERWLSNNHHAEMQWMEAEKRRNIGKLFEDAKVSMEKNWKDFKEILDKKNLSRKECLLLPLRTIAKALKI